MTGPNMHIHERLKVRIERDYATLGNETLLAICEGLSVLIARAIRELVSRPGFTHHFEWAGRHCGSTTEIIGVLKMDHDELEKNKTAFGEAASITTENSDESEKQ